MRSISKSFFLITFLIFSLFGLSACSSNEANLYNAIIKTSSINAYEGDGNVTLHISAKGLPAAEQKNFDAASGFFNNIKTTYTTKAIQNSEKTKTSVEYDGIVNIAGLAMNLGLWVDYDLTGSTPKLVEIFKLPAFVTATLPAEFRGKDYMVFDFEKLSKESSANSMNSAVLNSTISKTYPKFYALMTDYFAKLDIGTNIVKSKVETVSGEQVTVYEINMNDQEFKGFLSNLMNSVVSNETATKAFLKEYLTLIAEYAKSDPTAKTISEEEINKAVDELQASLPLYKIMFDSAMETYKDIKIIDDKGVTIKFTVNKDGYIINENGTMNLIFDYEKLAKIDGSQGNLGSTAKGILNIGMDFDSNITNINGDVSVNLPALTSQNSFDLIDLNNYNKRTINKNKPISVIINNKAVAFSTPPIMKNGNTLVPMRETLTALGSKILWNQKTKTVTAISTNKKIVIVVNSKKATVNGKAIALNVSAVMINGKVYIPLRFVGESLGASVRYDPNEKAVFINKK